MSDFTLKQQVLNNGCVSTYNKLHKFWYLIGIYNETGDLDAFNRACKIDDHIDVESFYNRYTSSEVSESVRVLSAHYKRTKRLKDKISFFLSPDILSSCGRAVFLTLTFNDSCLSSTSKASRRRYVARFLKTHSSFYVANIDYGKKHDREHYHALILCDSINYSLWHSYGAIKGEKVRLSDNDSPIKLAKYISKLTNHAIKETAKGCRLLYGRCV